MFCDQLLLRVSNRRSTASFNWRGDGLDMSSSRLASDNNVPVGITW